MGVRKSQIATEKIVQRVQEMILADRRIKIDSAPTALGYSYG
jgi:hypothetical protein